MSLLPQQQQQQLLLLLLCAAAIAKAAADARRHQLFANSRAPICILFSILKMVADQHRMRSYCSSAAAQHEEQHPAHSRVTGVRASMGPSGGSLEPAFSALTEGTEVRQPCGTWDRTVVKVCKPYTAVATACQKVPADCSRSTQLARPSPSRGSIDTSRPVAPCPIHLGTTAMDLVQVCELELQPVEAG